MTTPLLVIADDDADMRTLVRSTLQADFPDAIEVSDGRELFWQLLRSSFSQELGVRGRPIVVVADVRMPAYNGLDVLDAWQSEGREVPIVVITSFPDRMVRARVERLDATLVEKPFTRSALRDAVRFARQQASGAAAGGVP